MAAPDLSMTVPRTEVVPVCANAEVAARRNAARETRMLRFINSHLMDCSFRAPQLQIVLHAGGHYLAGTRIVRRFAGSQPGGKLRPWATLPTTPIAKLDLAFRLNRGSVSRRVVRKIFPLLSI